MNRKRAEYEFKEAVKPIVNHLRKEKEAVISLSIVSGMVLGGILVSYIVFKKYHE